MSGIKKIGLIAGGGDLPYEVIKGAKIQEFEIFVAALKGFAAPINFDVPAQVYGFGEIGKLLKAFKAQNCSHVVFAGNISRPDFATIKPDFRGVRLLPKVIKAAAQGDDALLKLLVSVFEKEGFAVLAPQDLCASAVIPKGVLGVIHPKDEHIADIKKAMEIAALIGDSDIGQGAVVVNGLVLAVEAQEGTDKMLARVAVLPGEIRGNEEHKIGVLAKRLKPGQEERIDLPTIGVATVELAAKAGLAGIVVQANKAFAIDKEGVKKIADSLGVFILGYEALSE